MLQIIKYTDEQEKLMEELEQRTKNELTPMLLEDDTLFYRFLKARNFNIDKAEKLLRKHLSDRKIYKIDEIAKYTPPEHMTTYIPSSFVGYDKEGHVVRYLDVGGSDFKGIINLFEFKESFQYAIQFIEKDIERSREQSKKLGKPITQAVIIVNMDKLSLFQVTYKKAIEWCIQGFQLYQDNFPERTKAFYIINTSFYFNIGYSVIKKVFAEALLQKFHIYGRNGWQEALLEIIDADVLPAFLGGNRTDPDGNPLCNTFICHGKKVPEELNATKHKKSIKHEKDVKKLTITRFACSELKFYITEPNTYIEWEFETKNRDIGFGLYYKDNSAKNERREELIPKQRVDTLLSSETGLYKCSKEGTYIITFDNSYSWIYSKEIYYRIRLIKPEEMDELK